MEAIRMVLVTLALVTGGVLALALVARLAARTERQSTGPRFPASLGDHPVGIDREVPTAVEQSSPVTLDTVRTNGSPAELDRRDSASPCHGSRYTHDGKVIQGPAVTHLAPGTSGRRDLAGREIASAAGGDPPRPLSCRGSR